MTRAVLLAGLVSNLSESNRCNHFTVITRWPDVAIIESPRKNLALSELERAERIAPQLVRNHPIARSTLRSIVYAERAVTREKLRRMSDRFHLDG